MNPFGAPLQHSYPQPEEVHPRGGDGSEHGVSQPLAVPLPPNRPSSQTRAPAAMGPMTTNVVIPARPKPGRKPLEHADAQDRRRVQNRLAQRNFRDKRQQKLHDCQLENQQLKREYEDLSSERERILEDKRLEKQRLEAEIAQLQRQLREMQQRASSAEWKVQSIYGSQQSVFPRVLPATAPQIQTQFRTAMPSYGASSVPTPPEDTFSANEIDYTAQFSRPSNRRPNSSHSDSASWNVNNMDLDSNDKCGFCTDDPQTCLCRQEKIASCAPVPGTCDMCQADPARAEACRNIASQAQQQQADASSNARMSTSDGPRLFDGSSDLGSLSMPPPNMPRLSCSQLIDTFQERLGTRVPSISELFPENSLQMYPSTTGGFDVDEQQAAQVLQSLSRRGTMVSQSAMNDQPSNGAA